MKANELMIGDWVLDGNHIAQVVLLTCDGIIGTTFNESSNIEVVEPILLTPEILEKNGFKLDKEDGWWWLTPKIGITFWEEGDIELEFENKHSSVDIHIKYLHQLQHALRLCGIEKEIEL